MAIAAKVSVTPLETEYPALSVENKPEKVDRFFEYKVNHVQSQDNSYLDRCTRPNSCCRV